MSTFNSIYENLKSSSRLLLEAELRPIQGHRFQPTGFPDLGPATFKSPDGQSMLLVESAQSMANRLEAVCWDLENDQIIKPLKGLSHIVVETEKGATSSVQEAHRLNSAYIIKDESLKKSIEAEVGNKDSGPLDIRKLAKAVFQRDAGAVIHGVFLEKIAGRLRLQRLLSAFIEAEGVEPVTSGGVKLDRVDPSQKGKAIEGLGNVPFSRTEFTASRTVAYFNLDLVTMRGYGLGDEPERLIVALSLFKVLQFLSTGLRLRTACDFESIALRATRPGNIDLSNYDGLLAEITAHLPALISSCNFGVQPLSIKSK
ncbi:MAG: type I-U CRISPR-associated protein Cas7 [Acidobacteria bacterium]|nr:type I-U CRISPR-associated protein Cas7 [Acidobacteriota bacterium]